MHLFGKEYRVDWAHLAIVSIMAVTAVVYLLAARAVSLDLHNLLLVQPTALLVVALYLLILPQCFSTGPVEASTSENSILQEIIADAPRVGSLAIALILYATTYEIIGFDVASFLFGLIACFICGERRFYAIILFAALSSVFITYAARFLVSTPITTSVI